MRLGRHAELARAANSERLLSSSRSTIFSPQIVAVVATRTSSARPSTSISIWPSCGRRRSTMFMSAMILMRLTSAWAIADGQVDDVVQRAVDAEADADLCRPAARCARRTRGRAGPG